LRSCALKVQLVTDQRVIRKRILWFADGKSQLRLRTRVSDKDRDLQRTVLKRSRRLEQKRKLRLFGRIMITDCWKRWLWRLKVC